MEVAEQLLIGFSLGILTWIIILEMYRDRLRERQLSNFIQKELPSGMNDTFLEIPLEDIQIVTENGGRKDFRSFIRRFHRLQAQRKLQQNLGNLRIDLRKLTSLPSSAGTTTQYN